MNKLKYWYRYSLKKKNGKNLNDQILSFKLRHKSTAKSSVLRVNHAL